MKTNSQKGNGLKETLQDPLNEVPSVSQFEGEAREVKLDGHLVTAVWDDGVMLSADNGKSPMMKGMSAPCLFKLEAGKKYRITVEEV